MRTNKRDPKGVARQTNATRMRGVYDSLPTPPTGCNGRPLKEWEASHNLLLLTGDEVHPRANVIGLIGRLGGLDPSTGDPLPEGHPEFLTPLQRGAMFTRLGVIDPPKGGFDAPQED